MMQRTRAVTVKFPKSGGSPKMSNKGDRGLRYAAERSTGIMGWLRTEWTESSVRKAERA